jgi:hypothetical protein
MYPQQYRPKQPDDVLMTIHRCRRAAAKAGHATPAERVVAQTVENLQRIRRPDGQEAARGSVDRGDVEHDRRRFGGYLVSAGEGDLKYGTRADRGDRYAAGAVASVEYAHRRDRVEL